MNENTINLCISIFYDKSKWDLLVLDAILPFISQHKNLQFYFYLNDRRGENIRLVFTVQEENAVEIATSIDLYFKDFLSKKPSELIVNEEVSGYFINFKNNSIHYGIFEDNSDFWQDFNIGITHLLFFAFSEYKDEFHLSINGIMFQIIIIFLNAIKVTDNEILKLLKELIEVEHYLYDPNTPQEIADLCQQYFADNKDTLLPYLKEYRNINAEDYEEKWEIEWHNHVCSFFQKTIELDGYDIKTALEKIMSAFNFKDKISFYSLMINSFENYNLQ
ncbi:hypothetical protein [Flavobacterium daemonense]|uniref:hypothetical protein n=1 Tax=Flavobacterium daemonense TaxID=1393049 RepID=UPI0011870FB4|nr:hypothetical protein [Flavobacterium daemonense]KAF2329078.1 hypothetical protein FND99_17265 [Flavobacterium daemonense]